MKLELRTYDEGVVVHLIFDVSDVPVIEAMTKPYITKNIAHNSRTQWLSSILLDSKEVSDYRKETLRVNLDPNEAPVFLCEMVNASDEYIQDRLQFRDAISPYRPQWAQIEGAEVAPLEVSLDEVYDDFYGIDLKAYDRHLKYAHELSVGFKEFAKLNIEI